MSAPPKRISQVDGAHDVQKRNVPTFSTHTSIRNDTQRKIDHGWVGSIALTKENKNVKKKGMVSARPRSISPGLRESDITNKKPPQKARMKRILLLR